MEKVPVMLYHQHRPELQQNNSASDNQYPVWLAAPGDHRGRQ